MFKTPRELKSMMALARTARFVYGTVERFGLHLPGSRHIDDFLEIGAEILEVTDSFNEMFADRGWIAHGKINVTAAIAAMQARRSKNWNRADEILAESYSPLLVKALIVQLSRLRSFRDRTRLAELAADDYEASRYHACVPVILALIDGMGQQVTGASLFRRGAKFNVPNSIVGLGPGLNRLLKTILVSRKRTTTAKISIPFRHGILHGTDLGYASGGGKNVVCTVCGCGIR